MNKDLIKILPITKIDLMAVFSLSNQGSIRAASFNQERIKLAGHKKWFEKKLGDKNVIMLKAVYNGNFAGQVRLDIEKDKALIGVGVDEEYRGRGIASKLLKFAISGAKKRNLKVIEAFIKIENVESSGLFEKNGFIFEDKTEISGSKANRYLCKL